MTSATTSRRVLLVRHGQCVDNLNGLVSGRRDTRLTVLGRAQALDAALLLKDAGATHLVSSDVVAAAMTAEVIADFLGLEVAVDEDLREQSAGALEGQPVSDVHATHPGPGLHAHDIALGGGESVVDVYDRVARFFGRVDRMPPGDVIVVSHGTWIQVALSYLAGFGPYEVEWADVPNGAIRAGHLPAAVPTGR